jgi:dolichol-phosphate mannosyltransferase
MAVAIFFPEHLERGWASLIADMVFLGGVQLIGLGMIGQYVSRIFEEGKRRPLYLLRKSRKSD